MLSDCKPIVLETESTKKETSENIKVSDEEEIRCSAGVVRDAYSIIGSAYFQFSKGNNKSVATCSVSLSPRGHGKGGSIESVSLDGIVICEVCFAPFLQDVDVYTGQSGYTKELREKDLASSLMQTLSAGIFLENYPKTNIVIHVQVLQSSPYDLSTIVNCGSLAVANANIAMKDIISSYTLLSHSDQDNRKIKEKRKSDEKHSKVAANSITLSMFPSRDEIADVNYTGSLMPLQLIEVSGVIKCGCLSVRDHLVGALGHSMSN